jgi:hypothetical protein
MNISISQHERLMNDLLPQNCKIDDRTEQDMLKFITDISSLFNFYDLQNKMDGDWSGFLLRDFSVLVNYIMHTNFSVYESQYQKLLTGFEEKQTEEELAVQLRSLIRLTHNFLDFFLELREQLQNIPELDDVFMSQVKDATDNFQNLHQQLMELRTEALTMVSRYSNRQAEANTSVAAARLEIQTFLPKLTTVFHGVHKLYNFLQGLAGYYEKNNSRQHGNTEPHIALIKVFIHLYSHLQEKLNQLPVKHLNYYYNTVLDLKYRTAIPDKVHIVAELVPGSRPVAIKQGMLLEATDHKTQKKYVYRAVQDQVLTEASIKEIKTLFLSDFLQIKSGDPAHSSISEIQAYKASCNYIPPASFIEPGYSSVTWPVLGEDQHLYSNSERTMEDTDMGFMIAAPVLYQRQGRREFFINIYFDNSSYNTLRGYFENFAAVSKKVVEEQTHELLKDAFIISYTVVDGWETVNNYAVRFNGDTGRNCVSVNFYIDEMQKPVDNYQQPVHGYAINTPWPLLRFVINNNSFHNPYSYLTKLIVEKITIQAKVTGFTLFNIRNNIGLVSTAAPFQAFGAQPVTGAWFDIRNSNVFNKYLKSFNIDVHWLDLPEQPGGFERYYEAYTGDFKTDAFIADIYNANDNKKTVWIGEQLFYEYRNTEGNLLVNPVSTISISHTETSRLTFSNHFPAKEITATLPDYEQVGVRVELAQPAGAFGHKQFLKILPEILLNNAKKSAEKKPIPNPPYTPLVKNVAVDFIQEQTVYFTTASNTEAQSLQFFHIGAFETGPVFPVSQQSAVLLLPGIEHNANLFIGLDNCKPEQELHIFIELAHLEFSIATEMPVVSWYFLQQSGWVLLNHTNIIEDGTNGLTRSGIIQFTLPSFTKREGGMNPQLQWIRASADTALPSHIKGIFVQAFVAERAGDMANITAEEMVLPPASITGFVDELPGIKAICQPFPSFAGMPPESYAQYNVRISEMLWHKNRPLTANEIAKTVLNAFPEILLVKCILPFTIHGKIEYDADLLLVVFPYSNEDPDNPDEPKVCSAKLNQVKAFVEDRFPFSIKLVVLNPVYEKVKVSCKIKLAAHITMSPAEVLDKLHDEIKQYLCPWLYEQKQNIFTGQTILQNHLLYFIQSRPYVAYVTSFSLLHFYIEKNAAGEYDAMLKDTAIMHRNPGESADDISISASVPYAVLVPAKQHNIEIIDDTETIDPVPTGISGLAFGNEFVVYYNDETEVSTEDIIQTIDEDPYQFHIVVDPNNL